MVNSLALSCSNMKPQLALLISLCMLLPGCMDDVNDAVNPEQELFDDNTFVNEDQHIKLTWTIESASTIGAIAS